MSEAALGLALAAMGRVPLPLASAGTVPARVNDDVPTPGLGRLLNDCTPMSNAPAPKDFYQWVEVSGSDQAVRSFVL